MNVHTVRINTTTLMILSSHRYWPRRRSVAQIAVSTTERETTEDTPKTRAGRPSSVTPSAAVTTVTAAWMVNIVPAVRRA